jgi:hypothetical protein
MYTIELTQEELPIVIAIIESVGTGMFTSKMKRYLKDVINNTHLENNIFLIRIQYWSAVYLLSTLYMSEVSGASASLMYKLEDSLQSEDITAEHIISDGQ